MKYLTEWIQNESFFTFVVLFKAEKLRVHLNCLNIELQPLQLST